MTSSVNSNSSVRQQQQQLLILGLALPVIALAVEHDTNRRRHERLQRLPYLNRAVIHSEGHVGARIKAARLIVGSKTQFFQLFQMDQPTFKKLCIWLRKNTSLRGNRYQPLELKVLVFLMLCGHGSKQRLVAFFFKITQSAVSRAFHRVLDAMQDLHKEFVQQPDDNAVSPEIEFNRKNTAFSGCIGAIDGTHIPAHIPIHSQRIFFDRKSQVSQNVFAAVQMDGTFTYVLAGAEGSMSDASLAREALSRSFKIPESRFYLGDQGFGIQKGILVPYPNVRYHLQDWEHSERQPMNSKELYNLRHARLRVIVEQSFGRLKKKFAVIRRNPPLYEFRDQMRIVYAVTGLFNFICRYGEPNVISIEDEDELDTAQERADQCVRGLSGQELRDKIAEQHWDDYQQYIQQPGEER